MKAVKRPIPIDVFEASGSDELHTRTDITWQKTAIDGGKVYNALHGSWINFKFGDYLNVTTANDIYPIDRATFDRTYDVVPE